MNAGLLYAPFGPAGLFTLLLIYVFVSFRRPLWGTVLFAAWVPSVWFWTYELTTRAGLTGAAALVLASAVLAGPARTARLRPRWSPPDVAIALFAFAMTVAAARGWMADHSRSALAGDLYHQLLALPLVYAVVRFAVTPEEVPRFINGWIGATAIVAALQIGVLALYPVKPEWLWMVGAPLDEGGVRLKPDFGFPTLAAAAAVVLLWQRGRLRDVASGALLLAATILTYKRTFWAAGGCGIGIAGALDVWAVRSRGRLRASGTVGAAVALGAALALLVGVNADSIRDRAGGLAQPMGVATVESRLHEFGPTVRQIIAHPWGIGLGGTIDIPTEDGVRRAHYVHNAYLHWTLLGGWPAGATMTAAIGLILLSLVRGAAGPRRDRWCLPITAGVIAAAVSGLAVQSFYSPLAALMLGLAVTRTERSPDRITE